LALEAFLKHSEIVGDAQAEIRQRATGVNEVDGNNLPAQLCTKTLDPIPQRKPEA
jgi:hypothetical protein